MTKAVTMRAKFPGVCTCCNHKVNTGEMILWTKGVGVKHADPMACTNYRNIAADANCRKVVAPPRINRTTIRTASPNKPATEKQIIYIQRLCHGNPRNLFDIEMFDNTNCSTWAVLNGLTSADASALIDELQN